MPTLSPIQIESLKIIPTITITSVKKRNAFLCYFSIEEWKVSIKLSNGETATYNCWGHTAAQILFSLEQKIDLEIRNWYNVGGNVKSLIGKSFKLS